MYTRWMSGLFAALVLTLPTTAWAHAEASASGYVNWLKSLESKIVGLAEAMPENKYDWRPAKDVRSVGEAYMHAAGTLYYLGNMLGTPPPMDPKSLKSVKGKKAVVSALKKALAHAKKIIEKLPQEKLTEKIDLFGRPGTGQDVVVLMLVHTSEHLGQGIAYARMNGVTPPWSKKK